MTITRRGLLAAPAALAVGHSVRSAMAQAGGTLRVVQPWEFRSLRMAESGFVYGRTGIVETLVSCDLEGSPVPGVAESWTAHEQGRLWRLRIRAGMRFHDGTAVTAAAAKASMERLLPHALYLQRVGISGIDAEGDDLVIRLKAPFSPFLEFLNDSSVPILAASAFDAAGEVTALVGTGPFRATAVDLPRSIALARHEGYWRGTPAFATARFDAVPNGETRANIAIAADADLVMNIPSQSVARVAAGRMRVDRAIIPRTHILMLNAAKPQFAEPRLRQALSMAIDRQGIATTIMRNPALAATQYIPPTLSAWHQKGLAPLRQDVPAANALLDAAGWMRGPDGIRARNGVRFAGTLRTFVNRPELPVIATAFQAQFRAIGFDLAISVGESQAITEGQRDGTLELGLSSRNLVMVPDPISSIALDFASDTVVPGAAGATNWRNDGLRRDVADYLASHDDVAKAGLRRAIVGVLQEELPVIPIVWYDQIAAVGSGLAGFVNDPFEQRLSLDRLRAG